MPFPVGTFDCLPARQLHHSLARKLHSQQLALHFSSLALATLHRAAQS